MGLTGLLLGAGLVGHATDQKGVLAYLPANPAAAAFLAAMTVAVGGYALWSLVRAVYDPLRRGDEVPGLLARLGFAWSAIAYGALCIAIVQYLTGARGVLRRDSVHAAVVAAMAHPYGEAATAVAGFIAIAAGLAQFFDAVFASFRADLKRSQMSRAAFRMAMWLGRAGYLSRGVIFTLTGYFILESGLSGDSRHAHGFGAAFDTLLRQPAGQLSVGLVGLGFIALALHSFFYARYVRTLSSPG